MKAGFVYLEVMVQVYVVQVQDRQNGRIRSSARKMGEQIGTVKLGRECPSDQSMRPFVEVTQHNARSGNIDGSEQIFVHQANRLFLPLPMRRAEVNVKDVHQVVAEADIGSQSAALFAAGACAGAIERAGQRHAGCSGAGRHAGVA